MKLEHMNFSLPQASQAIGVNEQTIKSWFNSGLPLAKGMEGGGGRGQRRRFTFPNVMELGIAAELATPFGTRNMRGCFMIAQRFAYFEWDEQDPHRPDLPPSPRKMALPYHHNHGDTFLVVSGEHSTEYVFDASNPHKKDSLSIIRANLPKIEHALTLINVSRIFEKALSPLGIRPQPALDAIYPEDAS